MAGEPRCINGQTFLVQKLRPLPDFFRRGHQAVNQKHAGIGSGRVQKKRHADLLRLCFAGRIMLLILFEE